MVTAMWDINYLIVHLGILVGVWMLFDSAPDVIQKITLFIIGLATVVYIIADVAALSGVDPVWPIRVIASRIEHAAVGVYIFRQVWIKSDICKFLKSSSLPAK